MSPKQISMLAAGVSGGWLIRHRFTAPGEDPFAAVDWGSRVVTLRDPDGRAAVAADEVESPVSWSGTAVATVATVATAVPDQLTGASTSSAATAARPSGSRSVTTRDPQSTAAKGSSPGAVNRCRMSHPPDTPAANIEICLGDIETASHYRRGRAHAHQGLLRRHCAASPCQPGTTRAARRAG